MFSLFKSHDLTHQNKNLAGKFVAELCIHMRRYTRSLYSQSKQHVMSCHVYLKSYLVLVMEMPILRTSIAWAIPLNTRKYPRNY